MGCQPESTHSLVFVHLTLMTMFPLVAALDSGPEIVINNYISIARKVKEQSLSIRTGYLCPKRQRKQ